MYVLRVQCTYQECRLCIKGAVYVPRVQCMYRECNVHITGAMCVSRAQCMYQGCNVHITGAMYVSRVQCTYQKCNVRIKGAIYVSRVQCMYQGCSVCNKSAMYGAKAHRYLATPYTPLNQALCRYGFGVLPNWVTCKITVVIVKLHLILKIQFSVERDKNNQTSLTHNYFFSCTVCIRLCYRMVVRISHLYKQIQ